MAINISEKKLLEFRRVIIGWREKYPLLTQGDEKAPEYLVEAILGEIKEAFEAFLKLSSLGYDALASIHYLEELFDVFVFLFSWIKAKGIDIDHQDTVSRVNGFGGRSDIFDQMEEVGKNLLNSHGLAERQLLIYLLSILKHFPGEFDFLVIAKYKLRVNTNNRPPFLYDSLPQHPVDLFDKEAVESRRNRVDKLLRLIRTLTHNPSFPGVSQAIMKIIVAELGLTLDEIGEHHVIQVVDQLKSAAADSLQVQPVMADSHIGGLVLRNAQSRGLRPAQVAQLAGGVAIN